MSSERKNLLSCKALSGSLPAGEVERLAEILRSLANSTRLRLVSALATGELTVNDLCEITDLKQSLVSQQLKNLRLNRIVQRRKEKTRVYYSISEKNVLELLGCLVRCGSGKAADSRRKR